MEHSPGTSSCYTLRRTYGMLWSHSPTRRQGSSLLAPNPAPLSGECTKCIGVTVLSGGKGAFFWHQLLLHPQEKVCEGVSVLPRGKGAVSWYQLLLHSREKVCIESLSYLDVREQSHGTSSCSTLRRRSVLKSLSYLDAREPSPGTRRSYILESLS